MFHALEGVDALAVDSSTYFTKHLPEKIRISLAKASLSKASPPVAEINEQNGAETVLKWKDYKDKLELDYPQTTSPINLLFIKFSSG